MYYQEIIPGERLRPYVRCYYIFESENNVPLEDIVFPGGHMEIIFNLGEGFWQSAVNNVFCTTPPVELWGKITQPLAVRSFGKNRMLGIRFHAHSAAFFLHEDISRFNDQVSDLQAVLGNGVKALHNRLLETAELHKRITLIEAFLLNRLDGKEKQAAGIAIVGRVIEEMNENTTLADQVEIIAARHRISSRYLRRLFLQHTGVSPKLYNKINRFQLSLQLVTEKHASLTAITYDCGYFDQSHFIRDFKSFTGFTPSDYTPADYPVSQAIAGK
jgi:AraC-like DNA-binding protein